MVLYFKLGRLAVISQKQIDKIMKDLTGHVDEVKELI
jgi:hypothetical protein